MGNPVYRTKKWKDLRARVLAEERHCYWCRTALTEKTAQVDHLIEIDRGGAPYDRDNLVAACTSCNASRGARYRNAKHNELQTAKKAAAKKQAAKKQPPKKGAPRTVAKKAGTGQRARVTEVFRSGPGDPAHGAPAFSLSEGEEGQKRAEGPIFGRAAPRLASPVPDPIATHGDRVAAFAKSVCRIELLQWQHRLLCDLLAYHPDTGKSCWTTATVSTGRQSGKSTVLAVLLAWWLVEQAQLREGPQQCLVISNKLSRAMHILRLVGGWMEPIGGVLRRGNNQPSVTMPDGSQLLALAATPDQHGHTADLICIDELFDIDPDVYYGAFLPAQRTRRNSLMCGWSTAGDEGSELLKGLRQRGIEGIEKGDPGRHYFAEWSAPPGVDISDRTYWAWACPSLGHLIDIDDLEDEAKNDWATFVRTGLNQWSSSIDSWLPLGAWDRQVTDQPMPSGGVLAVEKAPEESRWVGLRAATTDHGVQVHVEFMVSTEALMLQHVARVMADPKVRLLMPPGVDLRLPPQFARRKDTVGIREIRQWTSLVKASIMAGEIWHDGHALLTEHVNRAVAKSAEGQWYIMASRSPGPIELCRCMVWAAATASRPRQTARASMGSA